MARKATRLGKRGRPDDLTPRVQSLIVKAIKAGNTRSAAAQSAGVGERTLYFWLRRGKRQSHGKYRHLLQAVREAESVAESRNVAVIQRAGKKSWAAAAWWLERRRAKDWGRKDSVNHKHKGKINLGVEVEEIVVRRREELDTEAEG